MVSGYESKYIEGYESIKPSKPSITSKLLSNDKKDKFADSSDSRLDKGGGGGVYEGPRSGRGGGGGGT